VLIRYDPDEHETVVERHTCSFHQAHPSQLFAGCTCSTGIYSRPRSPEQVREIKAERLRKEEDRILAQAEIIKARRATRPVSDAGKEG
jgi:hypothetical protein